MLEFGYDYLSRRIEKKYSVYDPSTSAFVVQAGGWEQYIYDG